MTHVQHRSEADVDIHSNHFTGHQPASLLRQFSPLFRTEQRGERLGSRQMGETVAKTLHAPAFLIDGHHQMIARRGADLTHQLAQLRRIVIVAGKQDQAAHQRMRQNFTLLRIQLKPFNIQHDWTHTHLSYPFVCN